MTDERFEHEDEAGVLARYRKLPKPEPSAALDAAILAQARAAVGATSSAASSAPVPRVARRRSRWPAVFATAATLALAVGVSWQMKQAEQARQPVLEGVPVPQAVTTAPAAAPLEDAKQERPDESAETITVTGSRIKRTDIETSAGVAGASVEPAPASPQRSSADASRERRAEAPKPEPMPEIVFDEPLPMAEPAPPPADVERKAEGEADARSDRAPAGDTERLQEERQPEAAPPPAPPPPPAPAMSAPAMPAEATGAAAAPEPFDDAARDETLMRKESAPIDAASRNVLGATAAQRAELDAKAERELDRIERLVERRRFDAARRALADFRRDYPGYPVPRAITDALD